MKEDKKYDLEERTLSFAARIRDYVERLPGSISSYEIGKQLMRAGGSVGANYIEANEAVSKQDFIYRIKISRKEAKESIYWLKLTQPSQTMKGEKKWLAQEADELMRIFGSILGNSKK